MRKAIFLDRDGVLIKAVKINNKPYSIKSINDLVIINTVEKALKLITKKFLLIVVTNQPDVSRNKITKNEVLRIHRYLKKKLSLDDIFVCFHDNKYRCSCRKPKSGMLRKAKKKWNIDLKNSFLVGDRKSDILAGKDVGCKNFFINYFYDEVPPSKNDCTYVKSLYAAILKIKKLTNR